METPKYILDPDRDMLIVLKNAGVPFSICGSPDGTTVFPTPSEYEPVFYLVSSKHLSLSSPLFRKGLQGPWRESVAFNGIRRWEASDWDEYALLLFLRVIHGRSHGLHEPVSFGMVARVAVIADYYQCPEPISSFARMWTTDADFGMGLSPFPLSRQGVLAVCIAFVFSAEDRFKHATLACVRKSRQYIPTDDLPLPVAIMGKSFYHIVCFALAGC